MTDPADKLVCRSKHKYFIMANKPDTFLALALRKLDHIHKPFRYKLYVRNPLKVLHEFHRHLSRLYTAEGGILTTPVETNFSLSSNCSAPAVQQDPLNKLFLLKKCFVPLNHFTQTSLLAPMVCQRHTTKHSQNYWFLY